MQYVLGIDGGGTKTTCILVNLQGEICGQGEGGPANYQTIGIEKAQNSIASAINQAIAKIPNIDLIAMCLGLAGVGRDEDIVTVNNLVKQLELTSNLPLKWSLSQPLIYSDSEIALVGGTGENQGIVVIAGTGATALGRNPQGRTKRTSGWGPILGDEGSAYDIALQGLRAVVRATDGRNNPTILTDLFQSHLQLSSMDNLVELVYRRGWTVTDIAALAPLVEKAAKQGDETAKKIIEDSVDELVLATQTIINDLFTKDQTFNIVTIGGVWQDLVFNLFQNKISSIAPLAHVIKPRYQPAYGAALLALQSLSLK